MPIKYTQIILLAVLFILHYSVEHLRPQQRRLNNWKHDRFNLFIGAVNVVLNFLPATLLVQLLEYIATARIGLFQYIKLPFFLELILTVLILDAWMYAWHRMNHTLPFLWRWHRFHHRDEKMNSTTAVRFHIVELLLSVPGKGMLYVLMGFSFLPVVIYEFLFFTAVVFHHSNIRISKEADARYSLLFASPHMHRIHHSKRVEETHSNYGALFSFWDKLWKSWKPTPEGDIIFGTEE
jgi:sterol desaturase/sphingolipid hydroxylase (fatty acid hydroxylase superfamily)